MKAPVGRRAHVAWYGNVALRRGWCWACKRMALVIDGKRLCCGIEETREPRVAVRISEPRDARRIPPRAEREAILAAQGGVCLYCERSFGSFARWRSREVILRVQWDHAVPWSHTRNNSTENFVAACHICNGIKSNMCFLTLEDARVHITRKLRLGTDETNESDSHPPLP